MPDLPSWPHGFDSVYASRSPPVVLTKSAVVSTSNSSSPPASATRSTLNPSSLNNAAAPGDSFTVVIAWS